MAETTLSEKLTVEIGADFSSLSRGLAAAGRDVGQFANGTVGQAAKSMNGAFENTFGTMERSIARAARSGQLSISGMVNTILADLARVAVKRAISPLEDVAKSAADAVLSSLGGRAIGGPVGPGSAYVVGERGPELFVPSGNGAIVPGTSGAPARPSVVVNIQTANAQSFFKSETQVAAMMARALSRGQKNL